MKDIIKYYLQLIVLAFCLFTSACSDDDETVTPVFPGLQKIECEVGDTKTLTFEATDNWILTSSSLCAILNRMVRGRSFVQAMPESRQSLSILVMMLPNC